MIVAVLIIGGLGLLLTVLGVLIWEKQQITLLHDYHYYKVADENKAAFCAAAGRGVCVIGGGMMITALLLGFTDSAWSFAAFALGFVIGLVLLIRAELTYNR